VVVNHGAFGTDRASSEEIIPETAQAASGAAIKRQGLGHQEGGDGPKEQDDPPLASDGQEDQRADELPEANHQQDQGQYNQDEPGIFAKVHVSLLYPETLRACYLLQ